MKLIKEFSIVLATLAIAACEKNAEVTTVEEPSPTKVVVTLNASIASDDTKANVDNNTGAFSWASGDAIGVWTSDGKFTEFTLDSNSNGKSSGTFTAVLNEGVTVVNPGIAVYPYHAEDSYDSSTGIVTYNLPASYTWNKNWKNASKPAMYAKIEGNSLSFKHLGGIVRIPVTNMASTANSFRFISAGKRINGAFTFNLNDSAPVIVADDNSGDSVTEITFTAPDATGTDWTFSIPVPTGDYTSWTVKTDKLTGGTYYSRYSLTSTKSRSVSRGQLLRMPALNTNVPLETFESGWNAAITSNNNGATQYEIVDNPLKNGINTSDKVLKVFVETTGYTMGKFTYATSNSYFGTNFRANTVSFRCKVYFNDPADVNYYFLLAKFANGDTAGGTAFRVPEKVDGVAYSEADRLTQLAPGKWHYIEYEGNTVGTGSIEFYPFSTASVGGTNTGTHIIYFDDFEFLK